MSKRERDRKFAAVWAEALSEGRKAGEAALPTPMIVGEADGLSDRFKPGGKRWYVSEGVCGFAWVTLRPATSALARWLKESAGWRKAYGGGIDYWVRDFGQSYERKLACARKMAEVLDRRLGDDKHRFYSGGRLD